jgi:hypothetical protein
LTLDRVAGDHRTTGQILQLDDDGPATLPSHMLVVVVRGAEFSDPRSVSIAQLG